MYVCTPPPKHPLSLTLDDCLDEFGWRLDKFVSLLLPSSFFALKCGEYDALLRCAVVYTLNQVEACASKLLWERRYLLGPQVTHRYKPLSPLSQTQNLAGRAHVCIKCGGVGHRGFQVSLPYES